MKKQKFINNIVLMCTHTYIISKSKRDMGQQQAPLNKSLQVYLRINCSTK